VDLQKAVELNLAIQTFPEVLRLLRNRLLSTGDRLAAQKHFRTRPAR